MKRLLLLWLVLLPAIAFGQLVTDSFDGTTGAIAGTANWGRSGYSSGSPFNYSNNQASSTSTGQAMTWVGAGAFTDDQYAEVTLVSSGGTSRYAGVTLRGQIGTTTASKTFYALYCSTNACYLTRTSANSTTNLGNFNHGASIPFTIRLEITGGTLVTRINGSIPAGAQASYTDASPLTGGKPGVISSGNISGSAVIDDFIAGNVTGVPNVAFSAPAGTYYFTAPALTLSNCDTGTIYYTTDGSTPTHSSSVYSTPITLSTGTTTVKALCYTTADGEITTKVYTVSDPVKVTLLTADWDKYYHQQLDSISMPLAILDSWNTSGNWISNTVEKVFVTKAAGGEYKAAGAGYGADTTSSNTQAVATYAGKSFPNDQWVRATVEYKDQSAGIGLRCNQSGQDTGYYFTISPANSRLVRRINGGETTIKSNPVGVASGSVLELKMIGTQLQAYINGARWPNDTDPVVVDNNIASGAPCVVVNENYNRDPLSTPRGNGVHTFTAGGFTAAPNTVTINIREGNPYPVYTHSLSSTWTGLGSGYQTGNFPVSYPWVSGVFYNRLSGSPVTYWGAGVGGFTQDGRGGVGLNSGQWMHATTLQYRAPFGLNQWMQLKIQTNTWMPGINNWFLMNKSQLWVPGHTDGACTAAGNQSVCFDHIAYYLGVQPMNTSIYVNNGNRSAVCQPDNSGGLKKEYTCTPDLHITKVTPVPSSTDPLSDNYCGDQVWPYGCDHVRTVTGANYTPLAGDYVRGEYENGRLRAYCKGHGADPTWSASTSYAKHAYVVEGGNIWVVVTAGTSGGSAPSWPTTPVWDTVNAGTTVTDNNVVWMYYGKPCPSSDKFVKVIDVIDNDLLNEPGWPGLFIGGSADTTGDNTGWQSGAGPGNPRAEPIFTDFSAGTLYDSVSTPTALSQTASVSDTVTWSETVTGTSTSCYPNCAGARQQPHVSVHFGGTPPPLGQLACVLADPAAAGQYPLTSGCNTTLVAGRTYYADTDLVANDTCFKPTVDDVTVNLNGHELTYGNNQTDFFFTDMEVTRGTGATDKLGTKGLWATVDSIVRVGNTPGANDYTYGLDYVIGKDQNSTGHNWCAGPNQICWLTGKGPARDGTTKYYVTWHQKEPAAAAFSKGLDSNVTNFSTVPIVNTGQRFKLQCGTVTAGWNASPFSAMFITSRTGWKADNIKWRQLNPDLWNQAMFMSEGASGLQITNSTAESKHRWTMSRDNNYSAVVRNYGTTATTAPLFDNFEIIDAPHVGIITLNPNGIVRNSRFKARAKYTNGFSVSASMGTEVAYNTFNLYDPLDPLVGGRGIYLTANSFAHHNVGMNHGYNNNAEYSGCEIGVGPYGIQTEKDTASDYSYYNDWTGIAQECPVRARRFTENGSDLARATTHGDHNVYRAFRINDSAPAAVGISWSTSAYPVGHIVESDTRIEADTYNGEFVDGFLYLTIARMNFVKGTTDPQYAAYSHVDPNYHTFRFANYAGTATVYCIDCSTSNGADLTDVTGFSLTYNSGWYKQYHLYIQYTRTVTVRNASNQPIEGALVTMTDNAAGTYTGTTNASGIATLTLTQYDVRNTSALAKDVVSLNPYGTSITKSGCTTVTDTNTVITGTSSASYTMSCP